MLDKPRNSPKRRLLTTYDLEWRNKDKAWRAGKTKSQSDFYTMGLELRLCGVYDERGYRRYTKITDFLAAEMVPENAGRRFYAHFGGASDMLFLLGPLVEARARYSIRAAFSSSSAIMVDVSETEKRNGKLMPVKGRRWQFLDSFWTMRVPLAKVGAWLGGGYQKGNVDFQNAPLSELIPYNEQDCRILWHALDRLQSIVLDAGGQLGPTIASTALDIFRRKYLERPIQNSPVIDEWVRPAYNSSRVEPFASDCKQAFYWDINSSFPTSNASGPLGGDCLGAWPHLPKNPEDKLWVADCTINVPEDVYAPAVPYREPKTRRVFFPTGRFRTKLSSEDYLSGGFDIEKVHGCRVFEKRWDMRGFAADMYRLRLASDPEGFDSQVFKILNNSGYGKFAEGAEKTSLLVRPPHVDPAWEPLAPHCYLVTTEDEVEHSHVPFSLFCTARSRRMLLDLIRAARGEPGVPLPPGTKLGGRRVYYVDTDAVLCDAWFPPSTRDPEAPPTGLELREGRALGEIKLEAELEAGRFLGSKLYAMRLAGGKEKVKAKGMSRKVSEGGDRTGLTFDDFNNLERGMAVEVERMRRIRELVRIASAESERESISFEPDLIRFKKTVRLDKIFPKRCLLPSGDSRAWTVPEIGRDATRKTGT